MKLSLRMTNFLILRLTPQKSMKLPKKKRTSNQSKKAKKNQKKQKQIKKQIKKTKSKKKKAVKPQRMKKILIPMLPKKSNFNMNSLIEEYCFKFNTLLFCLKIVKFC